MFQVDTVLPTKPVGLHWNSRTHGVEEISDSHTLFSELYVSAIVPVCLTYMCICVHTAH